MDLSWINQNWVIALVATANTLVLYWQLSALRRKNDFDILRGVDDSIRRRFKDPEHARKFYQLSQRFADANRTFSEAAPEIWHAGGLFERLKCVADLSSEEFRADMAVLRSVVNTYNEIAQHIELGQLDARAFFSKYHLMVLREGWIIEAYSYYESLERNPGRWGLRVMQLLRAARAYHEVNPLHGGDVYLLRSEDGLADENTGCVWRPTNWSAGRKLFMRFLMRLGVRPVSDRGKRAQAALLRQLKSSLENRRRLTAEQPVLALTGTSK